MKPLNCLIKRHILQDEMDVLRETADQASKYEATIESYKRKLQELSDLKRHCKMIEDKNAGFIQINADLEEELKRQGAWKAQVYILNYIKLKQAKMGETKMSHAYKDVLCHMNERRESTFLRDH